MSVVKKLERMELLQMVNQFGFRSGTQLYWILQFKNLPENQDKTRKQLQYEIVEIFRLCSLSSFQKLMAKFNRIESRFSSRSVKENIVLLDR